MRSQIEEIVYGVQMGERETQFGREIERGKGEMSEKR